MGAGKDFFASDTVLTRRCAATVVETVTVDVSTTFLPQSVLHTLAVKDPDGDPFTCTATPPAGFTVDSEFHVYFKIIYMVLLLKYMRILF